MPLTLSLKYPVFPSEFFTKDDKEHNMKHNETSVARHRKQNDRVGNSERGRGQLSQQVEIMENNELASTGNPTSAKTRGKLVLVILTSLNIKIYVCVIVAKIREGH